MNELSGIEMEEEASRSQRCLVRVGSVPMRGPCWEDGGMPLSSWLCDWDVSGVS